MAAVKARYFGDQWQSGGNKPFRLVVVTEGITTAIYGMKRLPTVLKLQKRINAWNNTDGHTYIQKRSKQGYREWLGASKAPKPAKPQA